VHADNAPYEYKNYNDIFGEEVKVPDKGKCSIICRGEESGESSRCSK
jgi:hypothetical protein